MTNLHTFSKVDLAITIFEKLETSLKNIVFVFFVKFMSQKTQTMAKSKEEAIEY